MHNYSVLNPLVHGVFFTRDEVIMHLTLFFCQVLIF